MARTIPSNHPYPDPYSFAAALPITQASLTELGQAINFCHARGRAQTVSSQGWTDSMFAFTGAMPADPTCRWRVKQISKIHTTVNVWARAKKLVAGTGTVRFKSVGSGDTVDLTFNSATASWKPARASPSALDLTFTGGYDEVQMFVSTSDANTLVVEDEWVEYPEAASLAAPASTDAIVPIDDGELDADSPLSADVGEVIRTDLSEMMTRPRMYVNWSGLNAITYTGLYTIDLDSMLPRYFRWWTPVHPGSEEAGATYDLDVNLYAGDAGATSEVRIQHGPGHSALDENGVNQTIVAIPDDPPDWITDTIGMSEAKELPPGPPYPFTHIDIDGSERLYLYAVSIWGI